MKLRCLAVTFLSAVATVASAADPQLLKLVMPDAKVVSGIDVDRIKAAPFGQFFLSQLPHDSGFDQFVATTGFDPRRDVHEILMASPGDPTRKSGLLLVRGNFDTARVLPLIQAAGKSTENYKGVTILLDGKPGGPVMHGTAFLDNTLVVAGDLDSVHGAIDRRAGGAGITPELAAKISQTSGTMDAWLVSIAPVSAFAAVAPDRNVKGALQGDLLKSIQQSSGGVRFGNVIEVSGDLTTTTAQDATSLADVLRFLINMAQNNAPAGPAAQLAPLIKNLTVNTDANSVKLSVGIPETDLETVIQTASGRRRARI
jgi:hypothetical protein